MLLTFLNYLEKTGLISPACQGKNPLGQLEETGKAVTTATERLAAALKPLEGTKYQLELTNRPILGPSEQEERSRRAIESGSTLLKNTQQEIAEIKKMILSRAGDQYQTWSDRAEYKKTNLMQATEEDRLNWTSDDHSFFAFVKCSQNIISLTTVLLEQKLQRLEEKEFTIKKTNEALQVFFRPQPNKAC